jgi:hypothetical protein
LRGQAHATGDARAQPTGQSRAAADLDAPTQDAALAVQFLQQGMQRFEARPEPPLDRIMLHLFLT